MIGKIKGTRLVNLARILLTSATIVFSSSTALSQENKEEKKYKLNLEYEYPALIADSERANDLKEALENGFYRNLSPRKLIRLETFEQDRKEYNAKLDDLAERSFLHGSRDFLRSSEIGIEIEERVKNIEEKLKTEFAKLKLKLNGGRETRLSLDAGIRFGVPNTYGYVGTSFAYNGLKEVARAELRAKLSEIDLRLKTQIFDSWDLLIGAKTEYNFNNEGDRFFYTRLKKDNVEDHYLYNDDDNRYLGFEFRTGRINGRDDLQALFVLSLPLR